ncbi:MAG TPA: GTP 3',8-cyclase MoaA, partial [bacterium]|nr:GTP 3',8-cyclase MoaA [bacterium]
VTDRCNMRCVYCMPEDVKFFPDNELLTYKEIERIAGLGASMGITKIRLTGGEPLAREGIETLVSGLKTIEGLKELSLTTNGLLLERYAPRLAGAGLDRVNVSLDTLDAEKFKKICRAGDIEDVISGIQAAGRAGLSPIKVNVVVMRGRNDNEVADFVDFAVRENVSVRFIEFMPFTRDEDWRSRFVSREEIMESARVKYELTEQTNGNPSEPARYFKVGGAEAYIGFISPVSHGFCSMCNRLRLTADGVLLGCLREKSGLNLKYILRNGATDEEVSAAFRIAVAAKSSHGRFDNLGERPMHKIGG